MTELAAYDAIEPFGETRADLRAGIICSTTANIHSRGKTFAPADFMPFVERPSEKQALSQRILGFFKNRGS